MAKMILNFILVTVITSVSYGWGKKYLPAVQENGSIKAVLLYRCVNGGLEVRESTLGKDAFAYRSEKHAFDYLSLQPLGYSFRVQGQNLYLMKKNDSAILLGSVVLPTETGCRPGYVAPEFSLASLFDIIPVSGASAKATIALEDRCHKKNWLDAQTSGFKYDRSELAMIEIFVQSTIFKFKRVNDRSYHILEECKKDQP